MSVVKKMHMERNDQDEEHFRGDFSMEDSPSYEILKSHNLLTQEHRLTSANDLTLNPSNSTRLFNSVVRSFGCLCCATCCFSGFEVPNGKIRLGYNGRGQYEFFGPGVHRIFDPYYRIGDTNIPVTTPRIENGDCTIVTVGQGFVGYCLDRGQPVLLPPGLHQWKSPTLKFVSLIDLNQPVIALGPWTLLTIDQGYMAVTQDNGKQVILDGGSVYLLTHRNWKFEKFVSTKIQTDVLQRIEAASADNVIMLVEATVLWRIADVETAVRMSAETMSSDGQKVTQTIVKLRNDVLKQAEASLAFFVGTINFSDSMAAAAMNQRNRDRDYNRGTIPTVEVAAIDTTGNENHLRSEGAVATAATLKKENDNIFVEFNLYNNEKLDDAVSHANEITSTYGVEIISINIISAIPGDLNLRESLAAGAVAAANAQMMETTAQGKSRAVQIEAKAQAQQTMILAQADADAEILRAEGSKKAADLLATNVVSVELAKIDRTGTALAGKGHHASFFFGADPQSLQSLLANSSVVKGPDMSPSIQAME